MFLINAALDRGAFKRGGRLLNFCEFKGGVYSRGAFYRSITVVSQYKHPYFCTKNFIQ